MSNHGACRVVGGGGMAEARLRPRGKMWRGGWRGGCGISLQCSSRSPRGSDRLAYACRLRAAAGTGRVVVGMKNQCITGTTDRKADSPSLWFVTQTRAAFVASLPGRDDPLCPALLTQACASTAFSGGTGGDILRRLAEWFRIQQRINQARPAECEGNERVTGGAGVDIIR